MGKLRHKKGGDFAQVLCQAALTQLGGQCWHLRLEAGDSPGHPAHIEGDSSGITDLGRFKESKNILALAGVWELSRFPQWNSRLLFPHVLATRNESLWEGERQVWERAGTRDRAGMGQSGNGRK